MRGGFFLRRAEVNDAVFIKRHLGIIDVSAFLAGVEKNHPHCWPFFENFHDTSSVVVMMGGARFAAGLFEQLAPTSLHEHTYCLSIYIPRIGCGFPKGLTGLPRSASCIILYKTQ